MWPVQDNIDIKTDSEQIQENEAHFNEDKSFEGNFTFDDNETKSYDETDEGKKTVKPLVGEEKELLQETQLMKQVKLS